MSGLDGNYFRSMTVRFTIELLPRPKAPDEEVPLNSIDPGSLTLLSGTLLHYLDRSLELLDPPAFLTESVLI